MSPRLLVICVGMPRALGTEGAASPLERPWVSGTFKAPVRGPVRLGRTGLAGDGQADLKVHGGPEKAVLAYAAHHPFWREWLGRLAECPSLAPGWRDSMRRRASGTRGDDRLRLRGPGGA